MQAIVLNPPKKSHKSRFGRKIRKARKARGRRRNGVYWTPEMAKNPRKRRSRARGRRRNGVYWTPEMAKNPRKRRRGRARRRNGSWVARYAMNPVTALSGTFGAVTEGFKPSTLMSTVPYLVGGIGNNLVVGQVQKLPLPSMLKSGYGSLLVSGLSAALLGAGVGMVRKDWGSKIMLGGLVDTMIKLVGQIGKSSGLLGDLGCGPLGCANLSDLGCGPLGCANMGDYLTPSDAAGARSLGCLGCGDGIADQVAGQELAG